MSDHFLPVFVAKQLLAKGCNIKKKTKPQQTNCLLSQTEKNPVGVPDADAEVEGAPGAPLDVRCLDANKDYIIVTWKQPAVDGGNSILGYFVDRSVSPAKMFKFVWVLWKKLRR